MDSLWTWGMVSLSCCPSSPCSVRQLLSGVTADSFTSRSWCCALAMAAMKPVLYSAAISSCSYRVRIALSLKGVEYEYRAVAWNDPDYEKINPIKYVPALQDGDILVSDSLAIILYLEDKYPQHPLLPQDLKRKALNLQIANIVCSSIQPLQCYAVVGLVNGKLGSDESLQIVHHYIDKGFRAIEKLLEGCDSNLLLEMQSNWRMCSLCPRYTLG